MNRRPLAAVAAVAAVCVAVAIGALVTTAPAARQPAPLVALAAPKFVDETVRAGIDHTYSGGFEFAVGGGVAVLDCNGDGRPDLYLAGGQGGAALYRNDSPVGGALRFTRVPSTTTDLADVTGAYPIDLDGDRLTDLVVLRTGENVLLRGTGGCGFARMNEALGFSGGSGSATMAFSATWEAGAKLPTLAFGNYLDPKSTDPRKLCFDNAIVRPAASGTRYATPFPLTPSWCTLSMLFSDWNRSGRADLRVSNDAHYYAPGDGQEQLWRMRPGVEPSEYTSDDGWVRTQVEGMGIASYDLTGDGYPEVFLTSQGDNRLQTLLAPEKPTYRDIGAKRGVNATRPFTGGDIKPSTAWHDEFADVNNDGLVDLFIAKGNVTTDPDYALRDPSNLLIQSTDGTFREIAEEAGILSFDRGRGAALADFNLDGMLDLVVVSYLAPVRLWRNVGTGDAQRPEPMGNWLAVTLAQPAPNVDAIGAWVEVRVGERLSRRELTVGGGHAGGQIGWIHFGLGQASAADVRVIWPDGVTGPWQHVGANGFFTLTRGADGARAWMPGA